MGKAAKGGEGSTGAWGKSGRGARYAGGEANKVRVRDEQVLG